MTKIPQQRYFKYQTTSVVSTGTVKAYINEILRVTKQITQKKTKELIVLDVGSGQGEHAIAMAPFVKEIIALEPDKTLYEESLRRLKKTKIKNLTFYQSAAEDFHTTKKFDLVVCLTTFEHMPYPKKSFQRIFSLMKKKSLIYLTAPNKLWPYEQHYGLYFLSYLPLSLANWYVRVMKRGVSYEDSSFSRTYFGMKNFFDDFPCTYQFVLPSKENIGFVGCGKDDGLYVKLRDGGIQLIQKFPFLWMISKGFIMVIQKN